MNNNQFKPSVRRVNGITIYFKSKTCIYINDNTYNICVTRWDENSKGVYAKSWKPFCEKLYRTNNFRSVAQIIALAKKYDLAVCSARLFVVPDDVIVRPSIYVGGKAKNGHF